MNRFHGINTPLFSLKTQDSCGIGEIYDLIPLIKWCHEVGFQIIQLLPINDSGDEPSPYSALSANALHPIYLSLHKLPFVKASELEPFRKFNDSKRVEYHAVNTLKEDFLRCYIAAHQKHFQGLPEFQEFLQKMPWLDDYARYKSLKKANCEKAWWEWTSDIEVHEADVLYHKIIQFLLFSQWKEVKRCAEKHHIQLKGDIPILINRDSSDVWANQHLFQIEYAAGAPADAYSQEGQKWGFPLYNWQRHEESEWYWWKARLHTAEQLYHLYRLDHIVGFFRIWAIPHDKKALEGFFIPSREEDWIPQGEKILHVLQQSSHMIPIGEDLGMIPPAVRQKMKEMHIAGTKVMRWERHWHGDRNLISIKEYLYESMTTVSTHDSETVSQWWKAQPEEVDLFCVNHQWHYSPTLTFDERLQILQEAHATTSKYHINLFSEYLELFPELSHTTIDEMRINVPGVVQESNWSMRYTRNLEEIISHKPLQNAISKILHLS